MANEDAPEAIRRNIEAIARLEQDFLERRTFPDRISDLVGTFAGSITFVVIHALLLAAWVAVNTNRVPGIRTFDPYPFPFLSMVVSLEAVLLSAFVLMKQNRMSSRADERAHLDLQINMLTEREATINLQILQRLCKHLGLDDPEGAAELEELSQITGIEALAEDLKQSLPSN